MQRVIVKGAVVAGAVAVSLLSSNAAQAQSFPNQSRFQKVMFTSALTPVWPVAFASGDVSAARPGEVRIHNPRTGLSTAP